MDDKNNNNEQNEASRVAFSLQLDLMSSFFGLISDALEIWALIEAIEEDRVTEEEETKAQNELEQQLESMQNQIDQLTNELWRLKENQLDTD